MTVQTSLHLTNDGAAAEDVRRFMKRMFGKRQGVLETTDLAVTEKSGTPDMSVDVADGSCIILGDESANQGSYFLENIGTLNVVISASDPTNARKDLIVAQIEDSDYSGATDAGSIVVVTGTPAASPSEPAVPDNAIVLALVDVAASATSIVNANITDRRTSTSGQTQPALHGGIIVCTSSNRPSTNLYEGVTIFETDTNRVYIYDGSGWAYLQDTGEDRIYEGVDAGGTVDLDSTFTSYAHWPSDIFWEVATPDWATQAMVEIVCVGVYHITATASNITLKIAREPSGGGTGTQGSRVINVDRLATSDRNTAGPIRETFTGLTGGTTYRWQLYGQHNSGSGALRADASCDFFIRIDFLP